MGHGRASGKLDPDAALWCSLAVGLRWWIAATSISILQPTPLPAFVPVFPHNPLLAPGCRYVTFAVEVDTDRPVLVDKYLDRATELDVDALCDKDGNVVIAGVMEHIEQAGIHSGKRGQRLRGRAGGGCVLCALVAVPVLWQQALTLDVAALGRLPFHVWLER